MNSNQVLRKLLAEPVRLGPGQPPQDPFSDRVDLCGLLVQLDNLVLPFFDLLLLRNRLLAHVFRKLADVLFVLFYFWLLFSIV